VLVGIITDSFRIALGKRCEDLFVIPRNSFRMRVLARTIHEETIVHAHEG